MSSRTLAEVNKDARREVLAFANVAGAGFVVVFALLPFLLKHHLRLWPLGLAAILAVWARTSPLTLRPIERAWMKLGSGLGWINSRIILGVVFFVLITPLGLLFRIFRKKDAGVFRGGFDRAAESYRVPSAPTGGARGMERPF